MVDSRAVEGLPLVTRNYTQIIGLSPGITADVTDAGALGRGTGGTSPPNAHGNRSYDNNFQMNGLGVNDIFSQGTTSGGVPIPNPDTITEFKVQTGQYDAAYGRNAGANVNLVTKSGSNQMRGSVFEFFRDRSLNANSFFSNRNGQPKPVARSEPVRLHARRSGRARSVALLRVVSGHSPDQRRLEPGHRAGAAADRRSIGCGDRAAVRRSARRFSRTRWAASAPRFSPTDRTSIRSPCACCRCASLTAAI